MAARFYMASTTKAGPCFYATPEEREFQRDRGLAVALFADLPYRLSDPSSGGCEGFPMKIAGKTRFTNGTQHLTPDDAATVAINLIKDEKVGRNILPVVNYKTGELEFMRWPNPVVTKKLVDATQHLYTIDDTQIDPALPETEKKRLENNQRYQRYLHIGQNEQFALCGAGTLTAEIDRDRLTSLTTEILANISGLNTNPAPGAVVTSFAAGPGGHGASGGLKNYFKTAQQTLLLPAPAAQPSYARTFDPAI
jgi:hypothetical protein